MDSRQHGLRDEKTWIKPSFAIELSHEQAKLFHAIVEMVIKTADTLQFEFMSGAYLADHLKEAKKKEGYKIVSDDDLSELLNRQEGLMDMKVIDPSHIIVLRLRMRIPDPPQTHFYHTVDVDHFYKLMRPHSSSSLVLRFFLKKTPLIGFEKTSRHAHSKTLLISEIDGFYLKTLNETLYYLSKVEYPCEFESSKKGWGDLKVGMGTYSEVIQITADGEKKQVVIRESGQLGSSEIKWEKADLNYFRGDSKQSVSVSKTFLEALLKITSLSTEESCLRFSIEDDTALKVEGFFDDLNAEFLSFLAPRIIDDPREYDDPHEYE